MGIISSFSLSRTFRLLLRPTQVVQGLRRFVVFMPSIQSLSSLTAGFVWMKLRSTLCPSSSRMLFTPYLGQISTVDDTITQETHLIMVGLSRLNPQPYILMSLGSPIGSSISGRNMPLFPISTHFFRPSW